MKNKFIFIAFVAFLFSFSGSVFAAHRSLSNRTSALENHIRSLQLQVDSMKAREAKFGNRLELDTLVEMYAHGPAVVTSPALGVRRSADDASDLMISLSSLHEDLVLLKLRQQMDNYAMKRALPIPQRPIIALSGGVEGSANYVHNYNKAERNDVNLSRAQLDIVGEAGPWATAAMIIAYDDSRPSVGTRVSNSRLAIDRAFVTIGQLNKFPVYSTIGQIFAPFGKYSSYMVTTPSTKALGRFKDRMIVLGVTKEQKMHHVMNGKGSVSAEVYGYPGETRVKKYNFLEHTGFNLDLGYSQDKFAMNIGGSIIGNIAESDGMQASIFGNTKSSKPINRRIYGIDGRIRNNALFLHALKAKTINARH